MILLRPIVVALIAFALVGYAVDCAPMASSDEAMQCCETMPCASHSAEHSQDCCKTMVSSQLPSVLPAKHSVLNVPVVAVLDHLSAPEVVVFADASLSKFEASEHSPPELYTLYSSLLI